MFARFQKAFKESQASETNNTILYKMPWKIKMKLLSGHFLLTSFSLVLILITSGWNLVTRMKRFPRGELHRFCHALVISLILFL